MDSYDSSLSAGSVYRYLSRPLFQKNDEFILAQSNAKDLTLRYIHHLSKIKFYSDIITKSQNYIFFIEKASEFIYINIRKSEELLQLHINSIKQQKDECLREIKTLTDHLIPKYLETQLKEIMNEFKNHIDQIPKSPTKMLFEASRFRKKDLLQFILAKFPRLSDDKELVSSILDTQLKLGLKPFIAELEKMKRDNNFPSEKILSDLFGTEIPNGLIDTGSYQCQFCNFPNIQNYNYCVDCGQAL